MGENGHDDQGLRGTGPARSGPNADRRATGARGGDVQRGRSGDDARDAAASGPGTGEDARATGGGHGLARPPDAAADAQGMSEEADAALEAAFAAARAGGVGADRLEPSFAARLLADADAHLPVRRAAEETPTGATVFATARPGLDTASRRAMSWLADRLGGLRRPGAFGWGAAGGLACCALVGLWLGFAPPAALEGIAALVGGGARSLGPADLLATLDPGGLDV